MVKKELTKGIIIDFTNEYKRVLGSFDNYTIPKKLKKIIDTRADNTEVEDKISTKGALYTELKSIFEKVLPRLNANKIDIPIDETNEILDDKRGVYSIGRQVSRKTSEYYERGEVISGKVLFKFLKDFVIKPYLKGKDKKVIADKLKKFKVFKDALTKNPNVVIDEKYKSEHWDRYHITDYENMKFELKTDDEIEIIRKSRYDETITLDKIKLSKIEIKFESVVDIKFKLYGTTDGYEREIDDFNIVDLEFKDDDDLNRKLVKANDVLIAEKYLDFIADSFKKADTLVKGVITNRKRILDKLEKEFNSSIVLDKI